MKKIILHSLLVLGLSALPQLGSAMTAPHWEANTIHCTDCHQNHIGPKKACEFCHNNDTGGNYSKTSAPKMATHSSAVIGSNQYGQWERLCVDCHDPHVSAQCSAPLVSGTFSGYSTASGTTTFTVSTKTINDVSWQNPTLWSAKSGQERGLIMVVESMLWNAELNSYVDFSSEIIAATDTTITVQGEITQASSANSFKILYGQYIKSTINARSVNFTGLGGFALDESGSGTDASPNGVCQVCHTQTKHWRNDGSLADHFNGENCLICHEHELGFRPSCNACHGYPPLASVPGQLNGLVWNPQPTGSSSAGAHGVHVINNGISCGTCHFNGMPVTPVIDDYKVQMGFDIPGQTTAGTNYDGQILNPAYSYEATNGNTVTTGGSMTCMVYCHSDGTSVATGILSGQPSPSWTSGSTDCTSCHSYPPSYAQDQPKSNSHQRHIQAGFGCKTCHYGTTTDSVSIAATGNHGNGRYDVIGAPTFYANGQDRQLNLVYIFDNGGGTCSINSCHNYFGFNTPIRWGNIYLNASPSITLGDENYEINFSVNVTDCGATTCNEPFTCSFDWGDGTSENGNCSTSHIYPAEGTYYVTWNVWDAKNHTLENPKTTPVTAEEEVIPPVVTAPTASFEPATGIVTVLLPDTTGSGVPIARVYIYWGDRTRTVLSPPIQPAEHRYSNNGTYQIRVDLYDLNHNRIIYTYQEEPSLEVTVVNP